MTCSHERTEPVEVRDPLDAGAGPTTVVARICVACRAELPASWGCPDCQWVDVRRLGDDGPVLVPGIPCSKHRGGYLTQ